MARRRPATQASFSLRVLPLWLNCPPFADELVRCEPLQCFEAAEVCRHQRSFRDGLGVGRGRHGGSVLTVAALIVRFIRSTCPLVQGRLGRLQQWGLRKHGGAKVPCCAFLAGAGQNHLYRSVFITKLSRMILRPPRGPSTVAEGGIAARSKSQVRSPPLQADPVSGTRPDTVPATPSGPRNVLCGGSRKCRLPACTCLLFRGPRLPLP